MTRNNRPLNQNRTYTRVRNLYDAALSIVGRYIHSDFWESRTDIIPIPNMNDLFLINVYLLVLRNAVKAKRAMDICLIRCPQEEAIRTLLKHPSLVGAIAPKELLFSMPAQEWIEGTPLCQGLRKEIENRGLWPVVLKNKELSGVNEEDSFE